MKCTICGGLATRSVGGRTIEGTVPRCGKHANRTEPKGSPFRKENTK